MRTRAAVLSLLVAVVAAACGGSSSSPVDSTTACSDSASAQCAKLASCSSTLLTARYGTQAACTTGLEKNCAAALVAVGTGETTARIEACVQAYATWSCEDYLADTNEPSSCAPPAGSLTDGAACAFPGQCTSHYCAVPPSATCGTCSAPPVPGASCADLASCGPGLVCESYSKRCVVFATASQGCNLGAPCGPHLSCVGDIEAGRGGQCQTAVSSPGAACDPGSIHGPGCDYDDGFVCDSDTKACVTATFAGSNGVCGDVGHVPVACPASGVCSVDSGLGVAGTCTAVAPLGGACSTGVKGPGCLPPARCIAATPGASTGLCQIDDATTDTACL